MQFTLKHLLAIVFFAALLLCALLAVTRKSGLQRLLDASSQGDVDSIRRLVQSGQDPTEQDQWNSSALMMAASYGNTEAIEMLLESGVPVDERSRFQNTPLIHATQCGELSAVELLIRRGANAKLTNVNGKNALDLAEEEGHLDIAKFLKLSSKPDSDPAKQ